MFCANAELVFQKRQWTKSCLKKTENLAKKILNTFATVIPRHNFTSWFFFGLGHGRRKRSHWIQSWNGCSPSDRNVMNYCLNKHGINFRKITLSCKYGTSNSFYVVTKCKSRLSFHFAPGFYCDSIVHRLNLLLICCSPSCWLFNGSASLIWSV